MCSFKGRRSKQFSGLRRAEITHGHTGYIWMKNKEGPGQERREKMNWL